jgi:transcriptional regulator with XRE-family HTH domain
VRYNVNEFLEELMDQLNQIMANNLKQIRENKKLSLDNLATLTGVSKSMLGQIERGESNPTISTVWKIANGLKISFTSLIKEPEINHVLVTKADVEPMIEDHGKFRLYPMFPFREDQRFEVYMLEMDKGAYLEGLTHGDDSYEVITVFKGELTMRVGEEEIIIEEGSGMKIKTNQNHIYHNTYKGMTEVNLVIYYHEQKS